jgi:DNA-binding Lrp family transcriptional regulator
MARIGEKANNHNNDSAAVPSRDLLDETNRKIISLLEQDPKLSQIEIANRLGLSQSSIALRLDKLKRNGVLAEAAGIRIDKLGLQMARADLGCEEPAKVLDWANKCPLLINATHSIGDTNVSLYFAAEDLEMFHWILDGHLRRISGVTGYEFSPILYWERDFIVPLDPSVRRSVTPPCAMNPYCPRCPANPDYNGTVWNGGSRNNKRAEAGGDNNYNSAGHNKNESNNATAPKL